MNRHANILPRLHKTVQPNRVQKRNIRSENPIRARGTVKGLWKLMEEWACCSRHTLSGSPNLNIKLQKFISGKVEEVRSEERRVGKAWREERGKERGRSEDIEEAETSSVLVR